jgi:hypothetical protein
MSAHVGVEQVCLVEQEDRMDLVTAKVVHVRLAGEEQVGRGRARMKAERVAEVAVEVAPAERRVAAVRQAEARLGQSFPQCAEHARFADAGLAEQDHALPVGERFFDVRDERRLAFGEPEIAVIDLLGEGRRALGVQSPCHSLHNENRFADPRLT